jgi:type II secretory pathway component PulF
MLSHKRLASWYRQVSQHLEAGISLPEALKLAEGPAGRDRFTLADKLVTGASISEAMESAASWLPRADRIFISASEQTGRLYQTFRSLADRHDRIGSTQAKATLGLIYPLIVLHIAALVLPLMQMIDYENGFEWSPLQHLLYAGYLVVPIWSVISLIVVLAKTDSPYLHRILRCFPLLRRYSKNQSLANFTYALGTFLEAGIHIQTAWKHSVRLSQDAQIRQAYSRIQPAIDDGENPSELLAQFKVFPPSLRAYYSAGSQTGKLDQNLIQAANEYQAAANQAMTFAAIAYPMLLLIVVASFIIYNIFRVYGGYLDALLELSS